jgi:hypothetical protein
MTDEIIYMIHNQNQTSVTSLTSLDDNGEMNLEITMSHKFGFGSKEKEGKEKMFAGFSHLDFQL